MLDLGDELQRAASAVAISEAAPYLLFEIDHELLTVAAFVNWTASAQLRPDALELGVETISGDDESKGDETSKFGEIYPRAFALRRVPKDRFLHSASPESSICQMSEVRKH